MSKNAMTTEDVHNVVDAYMGEHDFASEEDLDCVQSEIDILKAELLETRMALRDLVNLVGHIANGIKFDAQMVNGYMRFERRDAPPSPREWVKPLFTVVPRGEAA